MTATMYSVTFISFMASLLFLQQRHGKGLGKLMNTLTALGLTVFTHGSHAQPDCFEAATLHHTVDLSPHVNTC